MAKSNFSAIRHIQCPYDGPRIVVAEFESRVMVWDLDTRSQVSSFETRLDFGGRRLAINPDGTICAVGAYNGAGLTAYDADSGDVLWSLNALKKIQFVRFSEDGSRISVGRQSGPLLVVDSRTGRDVERVVWTKIRYESSFDRCELIDCGHRGLVLWNMTGERATPIERATFSVLDAAFGPNIVAISEFGGPVRCFRGDDHAELWRYAPNEGHHVLKLSFSEKLSCFIGVENFYQSGGPKQLIRFDASDGAATVIAIPKRISAVESFARRGRLMLTSEGEVFDTGTGQGLAEFRFPRGE